MIFFGDFLQISPVHAEPHFKGIGSIFMNKITGHSKIALNLWRNFEFDELTINQRQAGDSNAAWKSTLTRIRLGMINEDDIKMLNGRLIPLAESGTDTPDTVLDQLLLSYIGLS